MAKEEGHIMNMFMSIVEEVVNVSKWQLRQLMQNLLGWALALYLDWTTKQWQSLEKYSASILPILNTAYGEENLKQRRQGQWLEINASEQ